MAYPPPPPLPDDWSPHVDVVRDHVSLKTRDEHFRTAAFLYENGDERDAIDVTLDVRKGKPFSEVEPWARALLLERAQKRKR